MEVLLLCIRITSGVLCLNDGTTTYYPEDVWKRQHDFCWQQAPSLTPSTRGGTVPPAPTQDTLR